MLLAIVVLLAFLLYKIQLNYEYIQKRHQGIKRET